jgi:hypothetical protein
VGSCLFSCLLSSSFIRRLTPLHAALLEYKCLLAMLVRKFSFQDTNATLEPKFSATIQLRIVGEEEGAQLPLRIKMVDN